MCERCDELQRLRLTPEVKKWAAVMKEIVKQPGDEATTLLTSKFHAVILEQSEGIDVFGDPGATALLASGMCLGYILSKEENAKA